MRALLRAAHARLAAADGALRSARARQRARARALDAAALRRRARRPRRGRPDRRVRRVGGVRHGRLDRRCCAATSSVLRGRHLHLRGPARRAAAARSSPTSCRSSPRAASPARRPSRRGGSVTAPPSPDAVLSNGVVEVRVPATHGPRIAHYGFARRRQRARRRRRRASARRRAAFGARYGGHRLWAAPEVFPDTYTIDDEPPAIDARRSAASS